MKESRIIFPGNPWPLGHRVSKFDWTAEVTDGDLWFFFHLETEAYDSESEGCPGSESGPDADWKSPITWGNFHSCTISATKWGEEAGFLVGRKSKFNLNRLSGREFHVDPLPLQADDDSKAFHIYMLGHDDVADHRIKFFRDEKTGLFDIHWQGKIALSYLGDYEFRYGFEAQIYGKEAPSLLKKKSLRLTSWFGL